jgi:hypothetical protein
MSTTLKASGSTVQIQEAGEDHVVFTCFVPKDVAADLAWQLEMKVLRPETYPKGSVQGRFRTFYKQLRLAIRGFENLGQLLDEKWPSNASAPWDEKSR